MEAQKTNSQNYSEQQEQCLRIILPDTEKYYGDIVIHGTSTKTDMKTNGVQTTCFSVKLA